MSLAGLRSVKLENVSQGGASSGHGEIPELDRLPLNTELAIRPQE
jgi:hypothetical protein